MLMIDTLTRLFDFVTWIAVESLAHRPKVRIEIPKWVAAADFVVNAVTSLVSWLVICTVVLPSLVADILARVSKENCLPVILSRCRSSVASVNTRPWWANDAICLNISSRTTPVAPKLGKDALAWGAELSVGFNVSK
uniref:Uncharacterized protein n=1 Tax=Rhodotorula taiwanensis RS1 TaxID=1246992 RepID=R4ZA13_9BASI|nr:hypothetical protein RHTARS1M_27 [Rhodotorula taiwanensis RS1]